MSNIRAIVYGKYRSIADLARFLGWTRQRATAIINRKRVPSLDDVNRLSSALDLPFEDVAKFFLQDKSQRCDN